MPPRGSEPAIPSSERQQTHALDRAANGNGLIHLQMFIYLFITSVRRCQYLTLYTVAWSDNW